MLLAAEAASMWLFVYACVSVHLYACVYMWVFMHAYLRQPVSFHCFVLHVNGHRYSGHVSTEMSLVMLHWYFLESGLNWEHKHTRHSSLSLSLSFSSTLCHPHPMVCHIHFRWHFSATSNCIGEQFSPTKSQLAIVITITALCLVLRQPRQRHLNVIFFVINNLQRVNKKRKTPLRIPSPHAWMHNSDILEISPVISVCVCVCVGWGDNQS